MLLTHCFASQATLDRARYWLTWHGFQVQATPSPEAVAAVQSRPRLTIRVDLGRSAAAHALLDSIDQTEAEVPAGPIRRWMTDQPAASGPTGTSPTRGTPIHWEAHPEPTTAASIRVAEYMLSRWE